MNTLNGSRFEGRYQCCNNCVNPSSVMRLYFYKGQSYHGVCAKRLCKLNIISRCKCCKDFCGINSICKRKKKCTRCPRWRIDMIIHKGEYICYSCMFKNIDEIRVDDILNNTPLYTDIANIIVQYTQDDYKLSEVIPRRFCVNAMMCRNYSGNKDFCKICRRNNTPNKTEQCVIT